MGRRLKKALAFAPAVIWAAIGFDWLHRGESGWALVCLFMSGLFWVRPVRLP